MATRWLDSSIAIALTVKYAAYFVNKSKIMMWLLDGWIGIKGGLPNMGTS